MAWNTSEVTLFRAELELLPKNGYTSCTKGGHEGMERLWAVVVVVVWRVVVVGEFGDKVG